MPSKRRRVDELRRGEPTRWSPSICGDERAATAARPRAQNKASKEAIITISGYYYRRRWCGDRCPQRSRAKENNGQAGSLASPTSLAKESTLSAAWP
mmetsp:Transcript_3587/g.9600  ORF Transcript_3587/g.9600 Transcript_3587/m.9600 type:complete len:97 (+) Transcript_3587:228-518(+)